MTIPQQLMTIYQRLLTQYGPRDWWPAESPEEVIIGAILVQNVAWSNVEKAISELRKLQLLDFRAILAASVDVIEAAIRPTRFYRSKATKLQTFAAHLQSHYAFDLHRLFNQPPEHLRDELLSIHGIGAETADDIVIYAAEKPTFVIDRYTKRIFSRLGLTTADMPYEDMRQWFLTHLPNDTLLFNEYHALIDAHGHFTCLPKNPLCDDCSLAHLCVTMTAASSQSTRVLTD